MHRRCKKKGKNTGCKYDDPDDPFHCRKCQCLIPRCAEQDPVGKKQCKDWDEGTGECPGCGRKKKATGAQRYARKKAEVEEMPDGQKKRTAQRKLEKLHRGKTAADGRKQENRDHYAKTKAK